jgi:hypothetical protein
MSTAAAVQVDTSKKTYVPPRLLSHGPVVLITQCAGGHPTGDLLLGRVKQNGNSHC